MAGRALLFALFIQIGQIAFANDGSLTTHAAWRYEADSSVLWARRDLRGETAHIVAATERGDVIFLDAKTGAVRAKYLLGPIPDSGALIAIPQNHASGAISRYAAVLPTQVAFLDLEKSRDAPAFVSELLVQPRVVDDPEFLDRLHSSAALDDGVVVATREGAAYRLSAADGAIVSNWSVPPVARARLMSIGGSASLIFSAIGGFRVVDISRPFEADEMPVLFESDQRDSLHLFSAGERCRVMFRDRMVTIARGGTTAFVFPECWHTRTAWVAAQSCGGTAENPGGVAILLGFADTPLSGVRNSKAASAAQPQGILAYWSKKQEPDWQHDVAIDGETHVEVVGDVVAVVSNDGFEMFAARDGKRLKRGPRSDYSLFGAKAAGFAIDKRVVLGFADETE